jgi:hypothetical protein
MAARGRRPVRQRAPARHRADGAPLRAVTDLPPLPTAAEVPRVAK